MLDRPRQTNTASGTSHAFSLPSRTVTFTVKGVRRQGWRCNGAHLFAEHAARAAQRGILALQSLMQMVSAVMRASGTQPCSSMDATVASALEISPLSLFGNADARWATNRCYERGMRCDRPVRRNNSSNS